MKPSANDSLLSDTAIDENESQQNGVDMSRNSDSESDHDSPIAYTRRKITKPVHFDSSTNSLDESVSDNQDKSAINESKFRSKSDSTMNDFGNYNYNVY